MELKISHGLMLFGGGGGSAPTSTPVGAPSGKVCVVTSVAAFCYGGGGGGQDRKCTDTKCTYTARASASETYIFRTHNTSAYIYNQCIFLYLWYGAVNDIILTKH